MLYTEAYRFLEKKKSNLWFCVVVTYFRVNSFKPLLILKKEKYYDNFDFTYVVINSQFKNELSIKKYKK